MVTRAASAAGYLCLLRGLYRSPPDVYGTRYGAEKSEREGQGRPLRQGDEVPETGFTGAWRPPDWTRYE